MRSVPLLLLSVVLLSQSAKAQPEATAACTGKAEGETCTFTYGGGSKAGQECTGCSCSGGTCGAGTEPGGGGGGGGGGRITCPAVGEAAFTGSTTYIGKNPQAAPLRGAVGCVDQGPLATRPTAQVGGNTENANNIYGPMEAGFTKAQPGASCLGASGSLPDFELPGGVDTNLAEGVMNKACTDRTGSGMSALLDYCGGHAVPFHYHERANCLYSASTTAPVGHSTRVGTAADGNGIYGHNVEGGCEPTDLDWCGGRTGVTPDSNGASVYYYVISNRAPFALGCFGPVTSEAQCRALYAECDNAYVTLTTEHGSDEYDLDCPCFDPVTGSNVRRADRANPDARPAFLGANGFEQFTCTSCTAEQNAAIAAQYSSQPCSATGTPTPQTCAAGKAALGASCTAPAVDDTGKSCAADPCVASDFGGASALCCKAAGTTTTTGTTSGTTTGATGSTGATSGTPGTSTATTAGVSTGSTGDNISSGARAALSAAAALAAGAIAMQLA